MVQNKNFIVDTEQIWLRLQSRTSFIQVSLKLYKTTKLIWIVFKQLFLVNVHLMVDIY